MDNLEIIEVNGVEHVIIRHNEGEYTSMLKSTWDELEAQKELGGTL